MLHFLNEHFEEAPKKPAEKLHFANVSRRGFLTGAATTFAVAAFATKSDAFARYKTGGDFMPNGINYDVHTFVSIEADGTVTLVAHRSEMGTGSRTSLPMVLADEMGADWSMVKIEQAEGDEVKYGNQDTDGSRSMRHHIQSMRQMGASVRHMMAAAAAEKWGVDVSTVQVGVHEVMSGSNKAGFGELAADAMKQPVPEFEALSFKDESEFRYIGKGNISITDLHDITTGKAIYGADVRLPGMKYAAVARPPVAGSKPLKYDAAATWATSGVENVMGLPMNGLGAVFAQKGGIAVIATNTDAAIRGRDALEIEWGDSPHSSYNSEAFTEEMRKTAAAEGTVLRAEGDAKAAFAGAAKTFSRQYSQAHMAHAMMEPPVAVASVKDGKCEIWAPVQSPYNCRNIVAGALKMDPANVKVNVTLLGGGFGRKSKADFAIEAAMLSQKIGAPVKVQWTREDDIQHSFYHTTSVEQIDVALDADNKVTGWRHNSVAPTILSTFVPGAANQFFIESGMGHLDMPFEIPNISVENGAAASHTRIGWFRAVSNIPRAWAVQSFASELAHELGKDDLDMMLELIGSDRKLDPPNQGFPDDFWDYGEVYDEYPIDTMRLKHVLKLAAEKGGWGKEMPEGEGLGLAVHRSFVTYVASCVHVKVVDGKVTVPEVHMAVDCGYAANPERIRSQMEGASVMGMTAALHSGVTFEDGAAVQSNFNDYEMVRSTNYPSKVHTHIVEHPFSVHASGVGEPGLPPIPPAIANALFHATGVRKRDLPMGESV